MVSSQERLLCWTLENKSEEWSSGKGASGAMENKRKFRKLKENFFFTVFPLDLEFPWSLKDMTDERRFFILHS